MEHLVDHLRLTEPLLAVVVQVGVEVVEVETVEDLLAAMEHQRHRLLHTEHQADRRAHTVLLLMEVVAVAGAEVVAEEVEDHLAVMEHQRQHLRHPMVHLPTEEVRAGVEAAAVVEAAVVEAAAVEVEGPLAVMEHQRHLHHPTALLLTEVVLAGVEAVAVVEVEDPLAATEHRQHLLLHMEHPQPLHHPTALPLTEEVPAGVEAAVGAVAGARPGHQAAMEHPLAGVVVVGVGEVVDHPEEHPPVRMARRRREVNSTPQTAATSTEVFDEKSGVNKSQNVITRT